MKICLSTLLIICFSCTQRDTTSDKSTLNLEHSAHDKVAVKEDQVGDDQLSSPMVYITQDGDKYHTADCRYSKTAQSVKLSQAKADGKTACGICRPNSKTGEKQLRCSAYTTEGKRCQRMTSDPTVKCFQHRDS